MRAAGALHPGPAIFLCSSHARRTPGWRLQRRWHRQSRSLILSSLSSVHSAPLGDLTAEMAINFPIGVNGLWDFGTYINGGSPDPTWNEIDQARPC